MHDKFSFSGGLRRFLILSLILFAKLCVSQRVHFNFIYDYNIARYLQGGYDDFVLEEGDYEVFIYEPDDYADLIFDIPKYDDIAFYADDLEEWIYDFPEYERNYFEFAENDYYDYGHFEYEDYVQNATYAVNFSDAHSLNYSNYFNSSENQDPVSVNATTYIDSTLADDLTSGNSDGYNVTDDRSNFASYNITDYPQLDDNFDPYSKSVENSTYDASYNVTDYAYPNNDFDPYSNWTEIYRYINSSSWKEEQFVSRRPIAYENVEVPMFELVPAFPIFIDEEDLQFDEMEVY